MVHRALSVGILGMLVSLSACAVDAESTSEQMDDADVTSDALGSTPPRDPAHSPFYTSRVDVFPQGNCGSNWKLNEWNNPYTMRWLDGTTVQISLRDPANPANSCRYGSNDAAGAECASMITAARKVVLPLDWNDADCLTDAQKTKVGLSSSPGWRTASVGRAKMTAPGTTTEVDVAEFRIYGATDASGVKRYEYNVLASNNFVANYNASSFAVNNGIKLANLNGVKLRMEYNSANVPPHARTALSCMNFVSHASAVDKANTGRWQYNTNPAASTGWRPMFGYDATGKPVRDYTPYAFVDVSTHNWCPTSFAPKPGYPVQ